jgi:hypothetical protein
VAYNPDPLLRRRILEYMDKQKGKAVPTKYIAAAVGKRAASIIQILYRMIELGLIRKSQYDGRGKGSKSWTRTKKPIPETFARALPPPKPKPSERYDFIPLTTVMGGLVAPEPEAITITVEHYLKG